MQFYGQKQVKSHKTVQKFRTETKNHHLQLPVLYLQPKTHCILWVHESNEVWPELQRGILSGSPKFLLGSFLSTFKCDFGSQVLFLTPDSGIKHPLQIRSQRPWFWLTQEISCYKEVALGEERVGKAIYPRPSSARDLLFRRMIRTWLLPSLPISSGQLHSRLQSNALASTVLRTHLH